MRPGQPFTRRMQEDQKGRCGLYGLGLAGNLGNYHLPSFDRHREEESMYCSWAGFGSQIVNRRYLSFLIYLSGI